MTTIITEITSNNEYDIIYKRIQYILETLDKYNYTKKLSNSNYFERLYLHKNSIKEDNPLQILIAEAMYKIKLLLRY